MDRDASIPTATLPRDLPLAHTAHSNENRVTLSSPAVEVMTDLTLEKAATIHPSSSLRQAEQMMKVHAVNMLFVVLDAPKIEGLITTTDLHGSKQAQAVHERQGHYDDLFVADVMTSANALDAVSLSDLSHASVSNVIATLKRLGRNHLLVVESAHGAQAARIRGVISRTQIERQLGASIEITPIATTFSDIEKALV